MYKDQVKKHMGDPDVDWTALDRAWRFNVSDVSKRQGKNAKDAFDDIYGNL